MGAHGEEIEIKLLLDDPDGLERVAQAAEARGARIAPTREQVNHYFDTPEGLLRRSDRTLRLREEPRGFTVTYKGPRRGEAGEAVHRRLELEAAVEASVAQAVLAGTASPLGALAQAAGGLEGELEALQAELGSGVVHVGTMVNLRTPVGPLDLEGLAVTLELDRTRFPGDRIECELELELPASHLAAGRELVNELLKSAGVEGVPAEGKPKRFFRALAEAGGER